MATDILQSCIAVGMTHVGGLDGGQLLAATNYPIGTTPQKPVTDTTYPYTVVKFNDGVSPELYVKIQFFGSATWKYGVRVSTSTDATFATFASFVDLFFCQATGATTFTIYASLESSVLALNIYGGAAWGAGFSVERTRARTAGTPNGDGYTICAIGGRSYGDTSPAAGFAGGTLSPMAEVARDVPWGVPTGLGDIVASGGMAFCQQPEWVYGGRIEYALGVSCMPETVAAATEYTIYNGATAHTYRTTSPRVHPYADGSTTVYGYMAVRYQ